MATDSLKQLIERSIDDELIDAHAIDQDGSNVLIIGDDIRYCSDDEARAFLSCLIRRARGGGIPKANPGRMPVQAAA